ncbi:MAG: glycosyltransferase [Nocardioides sp.]
MRTITEVTRALGVRALVSPGWGRLAALEPDDANVTVVGALDHDTVFPRCAAAVHHGGSGTTAASVGAGLPTVVCSVFADQPFWGARVANAGLGAHVRFKDLDRASLESALRRALAPEVRAKAADLGPRLLTGRAVAEQAADAVEAAAGGNFSPWT